MMTLYLHIKVIESSLVLYFPWLPEHVMMSEWYSH